MADLAAEAEEYLQEADVVLAQPMVSREWWEEETQGATHWWENEDWENDWGDHGPALLIRFRRK